MDFQPLGLALFIYSVALQAGPGFFSSFRRHGVHLKLGADAVVALGFLTTFGCSWIFHFDVGIAAGLFVGAMTSMPGLAVAVEEVQNSMAPATYGLIYCFGVAGVILFANLVPRLGHVHIAEEEDLLAKELMTNNAPMAVHHMKIIPFLRTLGVLTGGMTSTPGLAAAASLAKQPYLLSTYVTIYPVALIGMIIFTKLLIGIIYFLS